MGGTVRRGLGALLGVALAGTVVAGTAPLAGAAERYQVGDMKVWGDTDYSCFVAHDGSSTLWAPCWEHQLREHRVDPVTLLPEVGVLRRTFSDTYECYTGQRDGRQVWGGCSEAHYRAAGVYPSHGVHIMRGTYATYRGTPPPPPTARSVLAGLTNRRVTTDTVTFKLRVTAARKPVTSGWVTARVVEPGGVVRDYDAELDARGRARLTVHTPRGVTEVTATVDGGGSKTVRVRRR